MSLLAISTDLTSSDIIESIITTVVAAVIIILFAIYFGKQIEKASPEKPLTGFLLLFSIILRGFRNIVSSMIGRKFESFSLYFFYLFAYINLVNIIAIIGSPFGNPTSFLVIILSFGIITLIGMIFFVFYFLRWRGFLYFLNPLNFMSTITSFLSITLRLFGNVFAGFLIIYLLYTKIDKFAPGWMKNFNVLSLFAVFFHIYFDVITIFLQSSVFLFLTLTYWSLPASEASTSSETEETKKRIALKLVSNPKKNAWIEKKRA